MSKRFYDTTIWDKPWYRKLSPANKKAWDYINAKCDGVGLWTPDFEGAAFFINDEPDWDDLVSSCNDNIIVLPNGKWWLVDFCEFQYGPISADPKNKPHASYLSLLSRHGLLQFFELSNQGYKVSPLLLARGMDTLQEKEEEKEKEIEKDKETEKEEEKENCAENDLPNEAISCASLLFTLHRDNIDRKYDVSDAKVKKWAIDIERINRLDGRSWQEIENVIRWVKRPGEFWGPNIMSGSKLREKFPQVVAKMSASGKPQNVAPMRNAALNDEYCMTVDEYGGENNGA